MPGVTAELKQQMKLLNFSETAKILDDFLIDAEAKQLTCREFLHQLIQYELHKREEKHQEKRLKWAAFPEYKSLESFNPAEQQSLSKKQLQQLKELLWVEQAYNLILLGPPGVGKTHLAIGLGIEAIRRGYKVSFIQMDALIHLFKTQEITRSGRVRIKRIISSDLVIIDDLMFMAMDRNEANMFFQLVNRLYGQTSLIITSNKGPEDWGELLGDPAITTAILDRIIHKSEVVHLSGDSYRIKHRKTIFGNN
ncbi:IS21-like element helper ATPase IstB [Desulforamulus hydrothermalis]|uniref:Putative Insertion sequence IS21 ATP-binding protein n=1 Tax=Desulforamulus hydrothermalis Lam5 = DSM 18033 TaxID=1121428 RepID=K8EDL2_9FIRM|nr:IS21-like element helper ATPase IstB [Desulforamulus hydrothermalis]CCO06886.1 putative Insertion sequence IS21 ATP-binding protein [Desulforamulus hydrothermalis Lam5 = DSM 18033]